jgi:hypothetical protein
MGIAQLDQDVNPWAKALLLKENLRDILPQMGDGTAVPQRGGAGYHSERPAALILHGQVQRKGDHNWRQGQNRVSTIIALG